MPQQGREASLERFVARLTESELFFVKRRVTAHIRVHIRGLEHMPMEIVSMVSDYLEARDMLSLWQVSRTWRALWRQGVVCSAMCRRIFPGYLEYLTQAPEALEPHQVLERGMREGIRDLPALRAAERLLGRDRYRPTRRHCIHGAKGDVIEDALLSRGGLSWVTRTAEKTVIHHHDLVSRQIARVDLENAEWSGQGVHLRCASSKLWAVTPRVEATDFMQVWPLAERR
jgi:hypothetical protein